MKDPAPAVARTGVDTCEAAHYVINTAAPAAAPAAPAANPAAVVISAQSSASAAAAPAAPAALSLASVLSAQVAPANMLLRQLSANDLANCNAARDRFPVPRSAAALWSLRPAVKGEVTFRTDRPEWSVTAVPATAGLWYRFIACLHFPLRADSIILDFNEKLVCLTYKSLLSILFCAGISIEQVLFADSNIHPSPAATPLRARKEDRQHMLASLLKTGPCIFFGNQDDLDLQNAAHFQHPLSLMMRPSARKAVVLFFKGSAVPQDQLQKLAEDEYTAYIEMCREVCSPLSCVC